MEFDNGLPFLENLEKHFGIGFPQMCVCVCVLTSTVNAFAWRFMSEMSGLFNSKRAMEQAKIKYENLFTILDEPLIKLKFDIICLYVSPFIKMHENGRKYLVKFAFTLIRALVRNYFCLYTQKFH